LTLGRPVHRSHLSDLFKRFQAIARNCISSASAFHAW